MPTPTRRTPPDVAAFTLIEMLVVVAIISVLASMLLPALTRAREYGRRASCLGNTRQLVTAGLSYVNDYDEVLPAHPPWGYGLYGSASSTSLQEVLKSYVSPAVTLRCPTQTRRDYANLTTYAYFTGGSLDQPMSVQQAIRGTRLKRGGFAPIGGSDVAMFGDVIVRTTYAGAYPTHLTNHWSGALPDGGNVGYTDGSVRWLRYDLNMKATDAYVPDSTGQLTAGIPFNAIYVMTEGTGKTRAPYGSNTTGWIQMGPTGMELKNFY